MNNMSEQNLSWLEGKTCRTCGKRFSVLYPDLWAYKEGNQSNRIWYCSWKCLRAARPGDERKGDITPIMKIRRDRLPLVKELLAELDAGRDPVKYLEGIGYADPNQAYMEAKKWARQNQPELAKKFPTRRMPKPKDKVKVLDGKEYEKAEAISAEPLRIQPMDEPEPQPEEPDDWAVTAIRHPDLGEFYHDVKRKSIDWRTITGDEVDMDLPGWTNLSEELPRILKKLGVDV